MKKLFKSFGPPVTDESWFVFYRFWRPIEDWGTLKPKLRRALEEFRLNPYHTEEVRVGDRFELDFRRASKPHGTFFVMAGHTDFDAGGFMVGELVTNIQLCLAEKATKIASVCARYPEWWLVLMNQIDSGIEPRELAEVRTHVPVSSPWSKVILVNPRDHTHAIEL